MLRIFSNQIVAYKLADEIYPTRQTILANEQFKGFEQAIVLSAPTKKLFQAHELLFD